jgi:hypothetical protein
LLRLIPRPLLVLLSHPATRATSVALRRPPSAATPASPDPPASREPEPDPELELDDPEPEEAEPELDELDADPELDPEPVLEPVWVPELEPDPVEVPEELEPVARSCAVSPPASASVVTTLPSIHPAELVEEQDQLKPLATSAKRAAECPDRPPRVPESSSLVMFAGPLL